jgi:hypothetical protein
MPARGVLRKRRPPPRRLRVRAGSAPKDPEINQSPARAAAGCVMAPLVHAHSGGVAVGLPCCPASAQCGCGAGQRLPGRAPSRRGPASHATVGLPRERSCRRCCGTHKRSCTTARSARHGVHCPRKRLARHALPPEAIHSNEGHWPRCGCTARRGARMAAVIMRSSCASCVSLRPCPKGLGPARRGGGRRAGGGGTGQRGPAAAGGGARAGAGRQVITLVRY